MAVNANLLLLDEPFVSLDRLLVGEIHQLFQHRLDEARPTVMLVSHLIEDAARLADRVILLERRPATIVADIGLPIPRRQRDAAVLADYRLMLGRAVS
jgi:NitT/TauT family transport system ATP-binding protein/sulfonate transport system ATP-binding protein